MTSMHEIPKRIRSVPCYGVLFAPDSCAKCTDRSRGVE